MRISFIQPKSWTLNEVAEALGSVLRTGSAGSVCSIAVVKLRAFTKHEHHPQGTLTKLRVESYLLDLFSKPDEWTFIFRTSKNDKTLMLYRCYLNGSLCYRSSAFSHDRRAESSRPVSQ